MPVKLSCLYCSKPMSVIPARANTAKFCSYECRGRWRAENWLGEAHPRFDMAQEREKPCQHCGRPMEQGKMSIATFRQQKFCSRECAKLGQRRLYGADNPRFKPDALRRAGRGRQRAWAQAVISRDNATCQRCGSTGVELHAHHVKPFADHPELRWDVSNGETLCHRCHWTEHSTSTANAVNSGNIPPGHAEDNPEPSFGRKPVEGVTTRGQAYRRWDGHCEWCGAFISKRWSDVKGKAHQFCSKSCSMTFRAQVRTYRPARNPKPPPMAVIASTSAAPLSPEGDDIV